MLLRRLTIYAARLEFLVANKLPNMKYIQHDGYKIASNAYIARLKNVNVDAWEKFAAQARAIPNLADRAYVLAVMTGLLHLPSCESE